jgi:hypothetical protein
VTAIANHGEDPKQNQLCSVVVFAVTVVACRHGVKLATLAIALNFFFCVGYLTILAHFYKIYRKIIHIKKLFEK